VKYHVQLCIITVVQLLEEWRYLSATANRFISRQSEALDWPTALLPRCCYQDVMD